MTLVIAEIGINHQGDEEHAYRLIDAAVVAKANVAKFQLYQPELLAPPGETRDMLQRLLLPRDAYPRLNAYCKEKGIGFACTGFDADSLRFLLANTAMAFIKISSRPVDSEVYSIAHASKLPKIHSVRDGVTWPEKDNVSLLHCVSKYPTLPENANLARVREPWCSGISDHSSNIFVPLAAVALGAKIVECHLTLSKEQDGPDHKASLDPLQFAELVRGIRILEKALA